MSSSASPRRHRRVRTEAVPGSDPAPQAGLSRAVRAREDLPASWGEASAQDANRGPNHARLTAEKPPHY